ANPESKPSMDALQLAIYDTRQLLAAGPVANPEAVVTQLFERHQPKPTEVGQETIAVAIERGTADLDHITTAVVETTCATITEVMDFVVLTLSPAIQRLTPANGTPQDIPPLDHFTPPPGDGVVAQ